MTTDILPEEWKTIPGYEGLYEASSLGRIRSLDRIRHSNNHLASFQCLFKGKVKKSNPDKDGYLRTKMTDKDGKRRSQPVHRLVCASFHPNPENKPQVNHKNAVKDDNRIENLEWMTNAENHAHAYQNGFHTMNLHKCPRTGRVLPKNGKPKQTNKWGCPGVTMNKQSKKFRAGITFKGKHYYLGSFENVEDAIRVRKRAEKRFYQPAQ